MKAKIEILPRATSEHACDDAPLLTTSLDTILGVISFSSPLFCYMSRLFTKFTKCLAYSVVLFTFAASGLAQSTPVATNASYTLKEDESLSGEVSGSDGDGDLLTYRIAITSKNGSVSLAANGKFIYRPNKDHYGDDEFSFIANDGSSDSVPAKVTLAIQPVNDAPVAEYKQYTIEEDKQLSENLTATDADGDALTYRITFKPGKGIVETTPQGAFIYKPDTDANGKDLFGFVANDGKKDSAEAKIEVNIKTINDTPVAKPFTISVVSGQNASGRLIGFDSDGDAITYKIVKQPTNGNASVDAQGYFTYSSFVGFKGDDNFTYTVNDGLVTSEPGEVTIKIGTDNWGFVGDKSIPRITTVNITDNATAALFAAHNVTGGQPLVDLALDRSNRRVYALTQNRLYIYIGGVDETKAEENKGVWNDIPFGVDLGGSVLALTPDGRTIFVGGRSKVIALNAVDENVLENGSYVAKKSYTYKREYKFAPDRDIAVMGVNPTGEKLVVVTKSERDKLNITNDLLRSDVGNGTRAELLTDADIPKDFGFLTALDINGGIETVGTSPKEAKFSDPVSLKALIYENGARKVALGVKGMAFSPDGNYLLLSAVGGGTSRATAFGNMPTTDEGTGGIVVLDVRPVLTGQEKNEWVRYLGFIPTTEKDEKTDELRSEIRKLGWKTVHPQVQWARAQYDATQGQMNVAMSMAGLATGSSYAMGAATAFIVAADALNTLDYAYRDYGYMEAYLQLYPRDMVGASSVAISSTGDFGVATMQDTNNLGLLTLSLSPALGGYSPQNPPEFYIKTGTGKTVNGANYKEWPYNWAYPQRVAFTSDDSRIYIGMAGGVPKADLTNKFGSMDAFKLKSERDNPLSPFRRGNPPPGYLPYITSHQRPWLVATRASFDANNNQISNQTEAYNRWNSLRDIVMGDKKALVSTTTENIVNPATENWGGSNIPDVFDFGYLLPPSGLGYRLVTYGMPKNSTNFGTKGAIKAIEAIGKEWDRRYRLPEKTDDSVSRAYFIVGLMSQPGGGVLKNVKGETLRALASNGTEVDFPYFKTNSDAAHDFIISNGPATPLDNRMETKTDFDIDNTKTFLRLLLADPRVTKIELDPYVVVLIPELRNDTRIVTRGSRSDPKSRRDLDDHMLVTFGGQIVDLDVDSDNNGIVDGTANEESIEDQKDALGKIAWLNAGDSDGDGVPDYADGFGLYSDPNTTACNAKFAPMVIRFPDFIDLSRLQFRFVYSESSPLDVKRSAEPPYKYTLPLTGCYRIWKKDGDQPRLFATIANGGDYIPADTIFNASDLVVGNIRMATVYIEAVSTSKKAEERDIKIELLVSGVKQGGIQTFSDTVQMSNGIELVCSKKVVTVSTSDTDTDGIPDFADGLDLYKDDGAHLPNDTPEVSGLIPVTLNLGVRDADMANVRIRFHYSGSDPALIAKEGAEGSYTYKRAAGRMRLWRCDGDGKQFRDEEIKRPGRRVAAINYGGDYIAPDRDYELKDLGFTSGRKSVTLYMEAFEVSAKRNDLAISAELRGLNAETASISGVTELGVTAMDMQLVSLAENSSTTPVEGGVISFVAPEVKLEKVNSFDIKPNGDGSGLVGSLSIDGFVRSQTCDIMKAEDGGTIDSIKIYINGGEQPVAEIPTVVTKTREKLSMTRPYPFLGTFSTKLENVPFVQGVNLIKIEARDPASGEVGFMEYTVQIVAVSPAVKRDEFAHATITLTQSPSPTAVDTLTATFSYDQVDEKNVQLVETAPGSLAFHSADGRLNLSLTGISTLNQGVLDKFAGTLTHSGIANKTFALGNFTETAPNSLVFRDVVVLRGDDTYQSLALRFDSPLSKDSPNSISADLFAKGQEFNNIALAETGVGTHVFKTNDGKVSITLLSGGDKFLSNEPDHGFATVIATDLSPDPLVFGYMEETGRDSQVLHQGLANDSSAEDFESYAGFTASAGPSAAVHENLKGQLIGYTIRLLGPQDILDDIDYAQSADGFRQKVTKSSVDGEYYITMEEGAPVVLKYASSWQAAWAKESEEELRLQAFSIMDALSAHLTPQEQFFLGYCHGFLAGGAEFVVGMKDLAVGVIKAGFKASLYPYKLAFRLGSGDTLELEGQFFKKTWDATAKIAKVLWQLDKDQGAFVTMLLTQDTEIYKDLSDRYGPIFEYSAEIIEALWEQYLDAPPREQGYYLGRAIFEIAGLFIAWEKAAAPLVASVAEAAQISTQLTKATFLRVLAKTKFFQQSPKAAAAVRKLERFIAEAATTRMCFTAGTKVLTQEGPQNIEDIKAGTLVLSQNPKTFEQGFKPVTETFITHPDNLYTIVYCADFTGGPTGNHKTETEQLICTGEHPFWESNSKRFMPAKDLSVGCSLMLANGCTARVSAISNTAASGVTTYNFEVAENHTYFVGNSGVWVHNASAPCEHFFALYNRFRNMNSKTPQEAWRLMEKMYVGSIENGVFVAAKKAGAYTDAAIGNAMEKALLKDVFQDETLKLWTTGEAGIPPGHNMVKHFRKHVLGDPNVDDAFAEPVFAGITNTMDYVKRAHELGAKATSDLQFLVYEGRVSRYGGMRPLERWVFEKNTNVMVIKVLDGPDAGAMRTMHVRHSGESDFIAKVTGKLLQKK